MFSVHLLMDLFPVPVEMEHQSRPPRPPKTWNMTVGFFMVNGGIYLLVAALSVAIKMTDGWYRVEALQRMVGIEWRLCNVSWRRSGLRLSFRT